MLIVGGMVTSEKPKPAAPARKNPSNTTPGQLKKFGLTVTSNRPFTLRCDRCAATWSPGAGTWKMKNGYWRCPGGCNAPQ
jgi:hypothetical protein